MKSASNFEKIMLRNTRYVPFHTKVQRIAFVFSKVGVSKKRCRRFLSKTYLYREYTGHYFYNKSWKAILWNSFGYIFVHIFSYMSTSRMARWIFDDFPWIILQLHHYFNKLLINIFTIFTFNITSTYSICWKNVFWRVARNVTTTNE